MDINESIEIVKSAFDNREYPIKPDDEAKEAEALAIAIEAMKKQEPMKLRRGRMPMSMCLSIEKARFYKVCGNCRELVTDENYCPNCGQKLDWED